VNNRKVLGKIKISSRIFILEFYVVYRHGNWLYTTWRKVKIGDIVKVLGNEFFPADLVLLSSGFG
jgi:magnesium-transporting ATPase (P-type)